jgi:hypothetical protein
MSWWPNASWILSKNGSEPPVPAVARVATCDGVWSPIASSGAVRVERRWTGGAFSPSGVGVGVGVGVAGFVGVGAGCGCGVGPGVAVGWVVCGVGVWVWVGVGLGPGPFSSSTGTSCWVTALSTSV